MEAALPSPPAENVMGAAAARVDREMAANEKTSLTGSSISSPPESVAPPKQRLEAHVGHASDVPVEECFAESATSVRPRVRADSGM
ncbi:hypothetical protein GCM10023089_11820 [Quisquiliibacterium transsilvanicum]